jgi:hypothetical protein
MDSTTGFTRRRFLAGAGSAAALSRGAKGATRDVSLVVNPDDPAAGAAPSRWALAQLQQSLAARGVAARLRDRLAQAPTGDLCVVAAGAASPVAQAVLKNAGVSIAAFPEALGLLAGQTAGRSVLLAAGHDSRGLVYALLELADRVQFAADPMAALRIPKPVVERPANATRSIARLFCSDVEDKPWFHDREFWPGYLTMLAAQRFNRFSLTLGLGYDGGQTVTESYLFFAYPFLVSVPGYSVRAVGLPDAERDRNLEMLRLIGEQAAARGLEFQLGLWTHAYEWPNSPNPNYRIEGLNSGNHAPYCRDALAAVLKACPAIGGVTIRTHGESGVAEGSYEFWKTVFDGVARSGRQIELDLHPKGINQTIIDLALATGMPVKLSPKYWAEHRGMPYHQADIREHEMPRQGRSGQGLFALSNGERSFLRYGYGDLLREDRRYGVIHRVFPGTQRLLLWGDPLTAAADARAFGFCGSSGAEIMEPLSFKGRKGSGIAGGRCAYADTSLRPRWDWEKYEYTYRVSGRLLYNPDSDPDVWRRSLRTWFPGAGAEAAVEGALASAGRILRIVTTTHLPSAANDAYWPEMYFNQPIVDPARWHPYTDTPSPRVFGNVSPLDPQLFSRIDDFANELLTAERSGKYSPIEVAQWMEDLSSASAANLAQAEARCSNKSGAEFRRMSIDVTLQIGLGRFFAGKFRSAVLYAIYERSGDRVALEEALKAYRGARAAWAELAERAKGVYLPDVTVGYRPSQRGHWLDRLPAFDDDIADMARRLEQAKATGAPPEKIRKAIAEALGRPRRSSVPCRHAPPAGFRPGQPLEIEFTLEKARKLVSARMYYRHVNQAERFQTVEMQARGNRYRAAIPAEYTQSPYPLQYYFDLKSAPDQACLFPGFAANLANQPYFVVRRAQTGA